MNTETKVILTITGIPGSVRHFAGKKKMKNTIEFRDRRTKKIVQKDVYYKIPTYEYQPISKRINLTKEFFDYATSSQCPNWFSAYGTRNDMIRKWSKMSWRERLEAHLLRSCLDNNGSDYTYSILDD